MLTTKKEKKNRPGILFRANSPEFGTPSSLSLLGWLGGSAAVSPVVQEERRALQGAEVPPWPARPL